MMRTAALLLSLALLAGCTAPDTTPTMMHRHSALRQRPMQPIAQQPRQTPEPPRLAHGAPSAAPRLATPYAPMYLPPARGTQTTAIRPDRPDVQTAGYEQIVEDDPFPVAAPSSVRRPRPIPPAPAPVWEEDPDEDVVAPPTGKVASSRAPGLDRLPQFPAEQPEPRSRSVRLVNSKRIQLAYEIRDGNNAEASLVDIWYTQDGGRWHRYGTMRRADGPCLVEAPGEGVFGFLILARSEDAPDMPPEPQDHPQINVEVDVSEPEVAILGAVSETEGASRKLTIRWRAEDKNLRDGGVSIAYAKAPTGPWHPVVSGMNGEGQYVWKVPAATPSTIYLMIEAEDWAGNIGVAVSSKPVVFQMPRSPVVIKSVQPAAPAAKLSRVLGVSFED